MRSIHYLFVLVCLSTGFSAQAVSWHPADADRASGDFIQLLLPAVGLGMTWLHDDQQGRQQWAYTMMGTALTTQALKQAFDHTAWGERPNGGRQSFPSGHTSSACAGAFFIGQRYGWQYGLPALVPAGFVAYSRVDEELHHWRDVIAGCAIGAVLSYRLVQPNGSSAIITPELSGDHMAVRLLVSF